MYQPALNKKVIGRINVHEQINVATQENRSLVDIDNRKILIIHTGGTIGMFKD
jgi:L-asparaginase/Glu-tRNA(Gln) amidotransferase subunit D